MIYQKTYGISKLYNGKYAICTEISEDKRYFYKHANLAYKSIEVATKKAENFIRACHRNFTRGEEKITFEFKNMGIIMED